ncbi:hypothetical protein P8452_44485 [Trifolium repens]|nr:hypothetical protein P8452_44485 [Trifolium repens]
MGSKKKSAKKIELEEDAEIASNSSITAISDDEEANKDLSLEIIQKALLNRSTNSLNGAALNAPIAIADSKVHSDEIKLKKKKKKKRKKLESEIEAAVIVEEEEKENVATIEVAEKVEHAKAETSVVDTSDDVVLRNTGSESHSEEIKTKKKKKKKKKLESEIEAVNAVVVEEEKENVETIEVVEKVEHAEVEKSVVDMSDDVVLRNAVSESSEEIKTQKKKKKKKHESEVETVNAAIVEEEVEEKEAVETIEDPEKVEPGEAETGVVNTSDNVVLRKLLRGPRYFDPPSDCVTSVWGTCFNCGEEGHASFNCTAAKRKKPCFICGSLSHNVKKCTMARYCSTCRIVGHRSKDCPKKHGGDSNSESLTVCLRCGNSGHDMFLCKNDYSQDDLKEIQCYVCKKFGHLCCVNTTEAMPKDFSCYRCGQMGHIGWACSRLQNEAADAATPSSCYNCGEKGHFARECSSSVKVGNRKHKLWETPRSQKENGYMGYESAPHDNGNSSKKTRLYTEESDTKTPKKSKHRGGWMTEHPGEFSPSNSKRDSWRSPITPCTNNSTNNHHYYNNGTGSHTFGSKSYKMRNFHDGTPNSEGSGRTFHHGYSASRFTNTSSSNGFQRNYNGW